MTITRFAPSPTGQLHVGNIRTALHNWLYAKSRNGRFILRLDDTDTARSTDAYAQGIREDLAWLGLSPDAEHRQSDRFELYEEKFAFLRANGRVYACYETPEELELRRKVLLGRGLPPVYERTGLNLTAEEKAAFEAEGRKPHWRFALDHDSAIEWNDLIRGPQGFDPKLLSDPVIRRADGSWLYMLPSTIDDVDMGVTTVLRGEDHVSNTATQIQMFVALGASVPEFAHEALLVGKEGKLSKRLGSLGVSAFREKGIEPIAVTAMLARLGTSDPVEPVNELAPLVSSFDFARFGRAPARFDEDELSLLNQKIVHQLPYDAVKDRLPGGMTEAAWHALRPNLSTIDDAGQWWRLVTGPIARPDLSTDDRAFASAAREQLAKQKWSGTVWKDLTSALKDTTGRKGKALFLPLRLALTGMEHGPDMGELLPLIGREAALERLDAAQ